MLTFLKKIVTSASLFSFVFSLASLDVYAQSSELRSAKEEVTASVGRLGEEESLSARKEALIKIVAFSIAETNELIKKLSVLKNLPQEYSTLQADLLKYLNEQLEYQNGFLKNIDDENLDLEKVQALASAFKEWRATVYWPIANEVLNFYLLFQVGNILRIADSRFQNIGLDLKRFKNSEVINLDVLWPILNAAATNLQEAHKLYAKALEELLNYFKAKNALKNQPVGEITMTEEITLDLKPFLEKIIGKVMVTYQKFLNMSRMVDKMVEKE